MISSSETAAGSPSYAAWISVSRQSEMAGISEINSDTSLSAQSEPSPPMISHIIPRRRMEAC